MSSGIGGEQDKDEEKRDLSNGTSPRRRAYLPVEKAHHFNGGSEHCMMGIAIVQEFGF
jgi:hypothetical protein